VLLKAGPDKRKSLETNPIGYSLPEAASHLKPGKIKTGQMKK
jgi:hypothetical protein